MPQKLHAHLLGLNTKASALAEAREGVHRASARAQHDRAKRNVFRHGCFAAGLAKGTRAVQGREAWGDEPTTVWWCRGFSCREALCRQLEPSHSQGIALQTMSSQCVVRQGRCSYELQATRYAKPVCTRRYATAWAQAWPRLPLPRCLPALCALASSLQARPPRGRPPTPLPLAGPHPEARTKHKHIPTLSLHALHPAATTTVLP